MGIAVTWYKTTLQKDKEVHGKEKNGQFVYRKQVHVSKGNFYSWCGGEWPWIGPAGLQG